MSGDKLFVDTNIILYILSGDKTIPRYLLNRQLYTSVICEIEVLSYNVLSVKEKHQIKNFLDEFRIISNDNSVKEFSISLRANYTLKLPDAIVAATALSLDLPLVTADKQFRKIKELQLDLYEVK